MQVLRAGEFWVREDRATQAGDGYVVKKSWGEHVVEKIASLFDAVAEK